MRKGALHQSGRRSTCFLVLPPFTARAHGLIRKKAFLQAKSDSFHWLNFVRRSRSLGHRPRWRTLRCIPSWLQATLELNTPQPQLISGPRQLVFSPTVKLETVSPAAPPTGRITSLRYGAAGLPGTVCSASSTWPLSLGTSPRSPGRPWL